MKRFHGEDVTSLGSLEAEIMGLVWDAGHPVHGMEIAEAALYKRRAAGLEPIAFSTVATTLRRLSEKGLLTVLKRPGGTDGLSKREARTPYYDATVGREEMAARVLDNVSRTLLNKPFAGLDASILAFLPQEDGGCVPRPAA